MLKFPYSREGDSLEYKQNSTLFVMIRLYGSLLSAQAWLVYSVKGVDDGYVKRNFVS